MSNSLENSEEKEKILNKANIHNPIPSNPKTVLKEFLSLKSLK